jgi:hypothetical protein
MVADIYHLNTPTPPPPKKKIGIASHVLLPISSLAVVKENRERNKRQVVVFEGVAGLCTPRPGVHRMPKPPSPPSSTRGKAGRNPLKEEITPLLPTGIG